MSLIRTSLLNSIAVGVRILTSLLLNKILAVYVGSVGYAVMGQFQNFVTMITTLAGGAVNAGVTKCTAEHFDDEAKQLAVWKTAGTITLVGSITIGGLIVVLHNPLARWLLKDESYSGVFIWLGFGLVLFTLNALLLAILNGKKEVNRFVSINIIGSLAGLGVTGGLAFWWGIYGALVALAINQSIVFVVSLVFCWHTAWFQLRNLVGKNDPVALRELGKFVLMALTSAICIPVSQMLIRDHLGANFGWEAAGHWEALMRISGLYLMVVTTPLAVYYLPRIAEIRDQAELKNEILYGYRLLLPLAVAGAITIYWLRDWIVLALFTADFSPMRDLFAWQMIGDVAKIGSWLLGYVLIGKAMYKAFIVTEIFFTASWVGWVWLFTDMFGVSGAQMGYFANYLVYWLVMGVLIIRLDK